MESQYDLGMIGWLVCTVILGGLATVYGFLKKANKNYWSSSSSCFSLGEIVWTIRSVFKNLTHVVDSCSCCSHGVNSDCVDFQFSSWEERIISAKKRERKVGYFLKNIGSNKYTLAVIGKQSIVGHMSYDVYGSFARNHASHLPPRQDLKWNTKREVVDWLSTLITVPNTEVVQQVQYAKEGNSFFKVLIGEFKDSLNVPATYMQQYNSIKNGAMRLRNGENEWEVEVDGRVIKSGWNKFVKDHKLCEGDFLVFTALGEMFFNVAIFGQNGRIKEYPWFHAFNPDGRVVYA
ncbi:uncharacterized protein LOC108192420 [Daucus carota subsp. sativus]|nr:PREDICTED: uncharacterized protein LOC108192420 [Daucus carota subsp. sativus]